MSHSIIQTLARFSFSLLFIGAQAANRLSTQNRSAATRGKCFYFKVISICKTQHKRLFLNICFFVSTLFRPCPALHAHTSPP
ncbi:hypothetical protein GGI43DRAFT_408569 [Trichoderma evansii]